MTPRTLASLLVGLAAFASARLAVAYPSALIDESRLGPRLDQIDIEPHELWVDPAEVGEGPRAPRTPRRRGAPKLWVAIDVSYNNSYGVATLSGSLLFGGPCDHLLQAIMAPRAEPRSPAAPNFAAAIAEGSGAAPAADDEPTLKPPARVPRRGRAEAPRSGEPAAPGAKVAPAPPVTERIEIPVVVTPAVARAAVKAALRRAALLEPASRTDALASRARVSAVLPELRLRVARIVDDGQSLMPTEYDPYRTEATGGTTLWLDARATWRLDRLVFAEEEVALERIRNERTEAQGRLTNRVLESLFAWQKAQARAGDQNATPEEHLAAELASLEAEAELDLLTDGWFTAWRTARAAK